jgi:hypothetical protein
VVVDVVKYSVVDVVVLGVLRSVVVLGVVELKILGSSVVVGGMYAAVVVSGVVIMGVVVVKKEWHGWLCTRMQCL